MTNATDATNPRLLIDLPAGFTGLPLRPSTEDREADVRDLAAKLAPQAGRPADELVTGVHLLADLLAGNNVQLYGRFAVDDGEGEPVLADLALATAVLGTDDERAAVLGRNRETAAAALRRQYVRSKPHADARVVRLAAGPAMAAVTAGQYELPAELTRTGSAEVLPQIRCEVQLPTPEGRLVVLAVGTASETHYQPVLTAAMRAANSIRFEYPAPDAG